MSAITDDIGYRKDAGEVITSTDWIRWARSRPGSASGDGGVTSIDRNSYGCCTFGCGKWYKGTRGYFWNSKFWCSTECIERARNGARASEV